MAGEFVIGNMIAKLAADTSDFIKDMTGASNVAKDFKKSAGEVDKGTKQIGGAFGSLGGILKSAAIAGMVMKVADATIDFLKSSVREAEAAAKAQAQLEAVIKSTGGAAGVTSGQVNEMASELMDLTGVEDDLIVKNAAVMLTFTKVSEDVFPDAIEAALNMSAAMGQDLQSSIVQVGKALNEPIEGVGALRRVGVQLTDDQEKLVKRLVETGDVLGAQKIILGELQTEFGGTAKAMHEAGTGSDDLKNSIGNLKEEIGAGLIPATKDANELLSDWVNQLTFGVSAENALVEAAERGVITMTEANNQVNKFTWTSYTAADAVEWLKVRLEEHNEEMDYANSALNNGESALAGYTGKVKETTEATKDVVEANKEAQQTTKDWMAELDTGIDQTIGNWLEQLNFMQAGGGEIQAAGEAVKEALLLGRIDAAEARYYWNELFVAAQALQVDLGNITAEQAAENIRRTLNVSLQEAIRLLQTVNREAAKSITKTVKVDVKFSQAYLNFLNSHRAGGGPVTGGVGYVVGEQGPELFVPSVSGSIVPNSKLETYGNDVASRQGQAGSAGGDSFTEITINNYNEQAAAINTAMLWNSRRARLSARMG